MKKYILHVLMFDEVYDPRLAFEAKDLKDAEKKSFGFARYHGMNRSDVMVKEPEGLEANWSLEEM